MKPPPPFPFLLVFFLLPSVAAAFVAAPGQRWWRRPSIAGRLIHSNPNTPNARCLLLQARPATSPEQQPHQQAPLPSQDRVVKLQTMDYTTLLRVGGELRRRLLPGRVENAVQPDDYRCVMRLDLIGFDGACEPKSAASIYPCLWL